MHSLELYDTLRFVVGANIIVAIGFIAYKLHRLTAGLAYVTKVMSQLLIEVSKQVKDPNTLEADTLMLLDILDRIQYANDEDDE